MAPVSSRERRREGEVDGTWDTDGSRSTAAFEVERLYRDRSTQPFHGTFHPEKWNVLRKRQGGAMLYPFPVMERWQKELWGLRL